MEPASYTKLKQDLYSETFLDSESFEDYDIDEKIARALLFRVNLFSLNVLGKSAPFHELFPGVEVPKERNVSVDQLWLDERYQAALNRTLEKKYKEDPNEFAWVPQRQKQLETLLKSHIAFQKLSDTVSQEILTATVADKENPTTAQIIETMIKSKFKEFLNLQDGSKWTEIFELINSISVEVMGELFELCFTKFEKSNDMYAGLEILILLYIVIDHRIDFENPELTTMQGLQKNINQTLLSCQMNRQIHPGCVTELFLYRSSTLITPVLLRPFKNNEEKSNLLLDFMIQQFIQFSKEDWNNKDKVLLNLLSVVSRSKGHEVVIRLSKEAHDDFTKQFAKLLHHVYVAENHTTAYPTLYELCKLSPHVNSRVINTIFNIPFKPYLPREIKIKIHNPQAFYLFYNTKHRPVINGPRLIGITDYDNKLALVATNTTTKQLDWCAPIGHTPTFFGSTNCCLYLASSIDCRISFYEPDTGEKLGSTYLPKFPDPSLPNSLHVTPSKFCYFVVKDQSTLWLIGGQINKHKWKNAFRTKIDSPHLKPLGEFFAVENPSTKSFTIYNAKGEAKLIEECSDVLLDANEKLISIHTDPAAPTRSLLKISEVDTNNPREIIQSLNYPNMKILKICDDGTLVAYSKDQPTAINFIDWKNCSTYIDDTGIPFDDSCYVDPKNGAVWLLDRQKNNVIRCEKNATTSIGAINLGPYTKLVHVDADGLLYYRD